jgi:hypothetical protein
VNEKKREQIIFSRVFLRMVPSIRVFFLQVVQNMVTVSMHEQKMQHLYAQNYYESRGTMFSSVPAVLCDCQLHHMVTWATQPKQTHNPLYP